MTERLQKILASAGICSRRTAEEYILAGRVQVNGTTVTELGTKADPHHDTITLDGAPVRPVERQVYLVLHKPAGYVTTLKDPNGRALVSDLVQEVGVRLYPVGRLDYNSEGLLLMTNDGDWANRLMHPRHEVDKEYHVRVRGKVDPQQVQRLLSGVELEDGPCKAAAARILKQDQLNDWLSITIREGRNRQVRRMCAAVGLSVVRLRRIRYGTLTLGGLEPGQYRLLSKQEATALVQPAPKERPKGVEREKAPTVRAERTPSTKRERAPAGKRENAPPVKRERTPVGKRENAPAAKRERAPVVNQENTPGTKRPPRRIMVTTPRDTKR